MPAPSIFLSIRILQILAQQPPFVALSTAEILRQLHDRNDDDENTETWAWEVMRFPTAPVRIPDGDLETLVTLCLRALAEADLIVSEDWKDDGKRWRAVPRWPGRDGGGRDNGREPPAFREGRGDGEDGGGGIREVLAHPRLFALSEEDFGELLDRVTGVKP